MIATEFCYRWSIIRMSEYIASNHKILQQTLEVKTQLYYYIYI